MRVTLALICLCILLNVSIQNDADEVTDLPEYTYMGKMYSGYLQLKNPNKKFHYILHLADSDSENKPLVLWLNGGPGCSSLNGWILEHGPASYGPDGFKNNPFSWNKEANMLYMESPGNVGFSYISSNLESDLKINDDITARENLEAILDFFNKFPSMKDHDFYLSGESYAGIYVPMLANEILEINKDLASSHQIRLKGFLVGNGVADWTFDTGPATIDFAFAHSFTSYEMRVDYIQNCKTKFDQVKCTELTSKIMALLDGLNIYDTLQDCAKREESPYVNTSTSYFKYARWAFPKNAQSKPQNFLSTLFEESNGSVPCYDSVDIENYLNKIEVKLAMHVKTDIKWELCSDLVNEYYVMQDKGSIYLYPKLIASGLRILIFSGDTDMAVPFNGNQKWINNLNLGIKSPWKSWRAENDMDTIAGYRTIYNGLTFVTIKGTGHMVPQWKPKEAFHMFKKFLDNKDL